MFIVAHQAFANRLCSYHACADSQAGGQATHYPAAHAACCGLTIAGLTVGRLPITGLTGRLTGLTGTSLPVGRRHAGSASGTKSLRTVQTAAQVAAHHA